MWFKMCNRKQFFDFQHHHNLKEVSWSDVSGSTCNSHIETFLDAVVR